MCRSIQYGSLYLLVLAFAAATAFAEEPAVAKTKPGPATHTVKKGPLKITIELDGVFEGEAAQEIAVRSDEWTALVVLRAALHGAHVRKGDVLLELDPEKLNRAIADLRSELSITELSLQQNEEQLKALEKTTPLDLAASRRAARLAEEDKSYFFDVGRPFSLKATEFNLRSAKDALAYEQEEMRQLEKMYKADDITEETEAIVLQRARDTVERAKFALESAQLNHDQAMKYHIPRTDEDVKESVLRKSLEWEKNRVELPLALRKQRLELEKLLLQRSQADGKLKRLLADRKIMTIQSPGEGIVYYGKLVRGKAADSAALADALRAGGSIQPNQVVMTVVQPRPMCIRATVAESELHDLRPGLKGIATPAGYPDLNLPATLDTTSDIPISPGVFDARLNVDLHEKTKLLVPGMSCKVKLTPYLKRDALTVPPTAIVADEIDDQKQSVEVLGKDGTKKSRSVSVGRKTGKQVEITAGLVEGEQVVIEPEKDKKS